jgi:hypothetical protein
MARRADPNLYGAAPDVEDRNLYFIAYDQAFILFSCKN